MAKGGLDKHPAKWEVIRERNAWSASHQKEAKMMGGMSVPYPFAERPSGPPKISRQGG